MARAVILFPLQANTTEICLGAILMQGIAELFARELTREIEGNRQEARMELEGVVHEQVCLLEDAAVRN